MTRFQKLLLVVPVFLGLALLPVQAQFPPGGGGSGGTQGPESGVNWAREIALEREKNGDWERFSPGGYIEVLAHERAYPSTVGGVEVARAEASKYAAFRGVLMSGSGDGTGNRWMNLGPETVVDSGNATGNVSGRVTALAISPQCTLDRTCRLWVGTAGGGIWRTDDAMNPTDPQWTWIGRGLGTNSIGSLAVDPNDRQGHTIYVGTGETNSAYTSGAGTGLYRSVNGGNHWTGIPTMIIDPAVSPTAIDFTYSRGISAVVIEPGNAQVLYVATTTAFFGMTAVRGGQSQTTGYPQARVGLYKTENRGKSWVLLWEPPLDPVIAPNPNLGPGIGHTMIGVRDVKLDPRNPRIVYATAWNNAIHRSAASLENGDASFKPVFAIVGPGWFTDLAMFDVTVKDGHTRLYVYNGTAAVAPQGFYRLDNADVPATSLVTGTGSAVTNTSAWISLSSNNAAQAGFTSRRMCAAQCSYDLVVATPPGRPDTVLVGGVAQPNFGEPTIRSTNAGVGFSGFGSDGQSPRNDSHVDVRAVAFHPRNPDIAFVGSDGGVVRNDGAFVDISSRCLSLFSTNSLACQTMLAAVPSQLFFMNKGLQTLQFYNVALDPADPLRRLIGGLQDNSTVWRDGSGDPLAWKTLFPFGDGTSASGFHPTRPEVLFASFQSNNFFVNFRDGVFATGSLSNWVRTADPIRAAGERESVTTNTGRQFLTFDRVRPDTQFTAFQHVWRTQNNGGDQAFLEANCRFPGGTSSPVCGNWVPLGVAYPFAPGTTPSSPSRKPGDLTSDHYGTDRAGGLVVAVERVVGDAGTLWAATNMGRIFIAQNADGPAAAVEFVRIDTPGTPNRFVSRIFADPGDPNVAFVSYSGFSAVTPSTPGHIFRVEYNPATQLASFASVDYDLGDLPINTIAWDHLRADLYAATDFGPVVLRRGLTRWEAAGVGFPEALTVDLEIVPDQRLLVAATHGIGTFALVLRPVTGPPAGGVKATKPAGAAR